MASQVKASNAPKANAANVSKAPNVSSAVNTAKNTMSKVWAAATSDTGIIVMIACTILLFVLVIVYITFSMKSSNLKGKVLTKSPIKLNELSTAYEVAAGDIPKPAVGREYSYSFWLYVDNFEQTKDHKMIFYRGTSGAPSNVNPVVFMDKDTNKLYIAIKPQGQTLNNANGVDYKDLNNILRYNYFLNKDTRMLPGPSHPAINLYMIMAIDYVPIQRWVNFVIILDNKLITIYLDGEIYSVKTAEEFKSMREKEKYTQGDKNQDYYNPSIIVDKPDGSIYIGKTATIGNNNTVDGYLSKLEFHNYALSINDVKSIYKSGPLGSGILSSLGIPYRIRSPLYRIGDDSDTMKN